MSTDEIGGLPGLAAGQQAIDTLRINRAQAKMRKAESLEDTMANGSQTGTEQAEVEKAASQFEALLVHQMLNAMWKTVPKEGLFGASREQDLYRDMLHEGLSEQIADGTGIGIKEVIMRDINRLEGK